MAKIESLSELDDYYKEKKTEERRKKFPSRTVSLIIAIALSVVLGIVVYKIVDGMVTKKNPAEENYIGEQLNLNNENAQILYEYVTKGYDGNRIMKFVTGDVDANSFSNREKIEYALQFAQPEDFSFTGEYNDKKQKVYFFSERTLQKYISLYFGPNVSVEAESQFSYPFLFYINKMNEGAFTYNQTSAGYDVIFSTQYDFGSHKNMIDGAYGQLISALQQPEGSIVLQERVVYTELRTDNGGYAVDIYKDPGKQEKLDTKSGLNDTTIKDFSIDITQYSSTVIVEYTFGLNGQTLYFKSSRIIL